MHLEQYVRRMGRRAARFAALGGIEPVFKVHAEMCTQVAAAHGFTMDERDARALCAYLTPALLQSLTAEDDVAAPSDHAAEPARTRALCIATLTHALARAVQVWLTGIGFVERAALQRT